MSSHAVNLDKVEREKTRKNYIQKSKRDKEADGHNFVARADLLAT